MGMTDRELMQTALEAMEHLHRTGDTQVFDLYAAPEIIPALRERLAHCDRCGKKMGGEGDIHTCSPDPIGDAQDRLIAEMAAQPEQEPVGMRWRWPGYAWVYTEEIRSDLAGNPEKELLYTTPPAAQQEEPVAIALNTGTKQGVKWLKNVEHGVNLYTTPPAVQRQWVGLTKADINEIWKGEPMLLPWDMTRTLAIEQRLKEKNT
jgi:hypothetical protein